MFLFCFLFLSSEWVQHCWWCWETVRTYGKSSRNIGSLQAATAVCLSPLALGLPRCHFPQFPLLVMVAGSHAGYHSCGLLLTHCDGQVSNDCRIRLMPVTIATSCCQGNLAHLWNIMDAWTSGEMGHVSRVKSLWGEHWWAYENQSDSASVSLSARLRVL